MGNFFRKQGVVRIIVIVVALLLVAGVIGGMAAMSKSSGSTSPTKTVTTPSTPSNSGSNNQGGSSGNEGGGNSGSGLTDGEYLIIDNQSSEEVEIYYEVDKSEYGNTFVSANSSETISINTNYEYFIRYSSGGSDNRHTFSGTYDGVSGYETEVYYYDGNICPPQETTMTNWCFVTSDCGTLLIRDAK